MLIRRTVLTAFICLIFSATVTAQIKDSILFEGKENGVWKKNELDIITRDDFCSIVSILQLR